MARRVSLPTCALLALSLALPWRAPAQETPGNGALAKPERIGQLDVSAIPESSGLVKSPKHPGVFWTHNDSGNAAQVFAISETGKLLRTVMLPKTQNADWEDIAADEQGRLLVGDFGDNARRRPNVLICRFAEPDPSCMTEAAPDVEVFRFRYPPEVEPQDCEALVARGGFAYVFTKEPRRTRVFRVPLPERPPAGVVTAEFVGEAARLGLVTGADLTPDGTHLAVLTYTQATVFDLPGPLQKVAAPLPAPPGAPKQVDADGQASAGEDRGFLTAPRRSQMVLIGQTEAIAWDNDDLLLTTESRDKFPTGGDLWRIRKAK